MTHGRSESALNCFSQLQNIRLIAWGAFKVKRIKSNHENRQVRWGEWEQGPWFPHALNTWDRLFCDLWSLRDERELPVAGASSCFEVRALKPRCQHYFCPSRLAGSHGSVQCILESILSLLSSFPFQSVPNGTAAGACSKEPEPVAGMGVENRNDAVFPLGRSSMDIMRMAFPFLLLDGLGEPRVRKNNDAAFFLFCCSLPELVEVNIYRLQLLAGCCQTCIFHEKLTPSFPPHPGSKRLLNSACWSPVTFLSLLSENSWDPLAASAFPFLSFVLLLFKPPKVCLQNCLVIIFICSLRLNFLAALSLSAEVISCSVFCQLWFLLGLQGLCRERRALQTTPLVILHRSTLWTSSLPDAFPC